MLCAFVAVTTSASAQTANTGLNIGVSLSGTFVDLDVRETETAPAMPTEPVYEAGKSGFDNFGATLAIGYNLPLGIVIAGIIADITLADFSNNYGGNSYDADYMATLRAQIGMQVLPGVMAYLTGGFAWLDASYSGAIIMAPPATTPTVMSKDNSILNGWVIGIGGEIDTGLNFGTGPVMARAEYLYGEFEDWKFWKGTELYDIDVEQNIVRIGVVVPLGIGAGN